MAKKDGKVKPGTAEELMALIPAEVPVAVKVRRSDSEAFDDEVVTVTEMDISQIAQAIRALAPIQAAITPTASFVVLAAEHPDEIFAALGVAIRWPAQKVGMLGGASFLRVADAVWKANPDFFGRALALLVSGVRGMMPRSGAGGAPSPTSGSTATSNTPSASPSASSMLQ